MREDPRIIAIIPARSGSKGLQNKNIRLCAGKPLMAYTIEAAIKAGIFECVHVSTDSEEYAAIGREYGADIPFLRSADTSSDKASSWDVVLEVLKKYSELKRKFDIVMLLQPTSPLRDADDIIGAYKEYVEKKAKAIVSVCEMEHSPMWSNTLPDDLSMDGFIEKQGYGRRQEFSIYYRLNGAIYMTEINFLQTEQMIYRKGCYAYVMDREKSIDIDTIFDFNIAEYILKKGQNKHII